MNRRHTRTGTNTRAGLGTLAIAAIVAVAGVGGCASGTSGSGSPGDSETTPGQRRNVIRIDGYAPIEITNEASIGVRTIAAGSDVAWGVLGGVYTQLDIPVAASDARGMQLGNPGYSANRVGGDRMNTYLDCGTNLSGALANQYAVTLTVMTKLTAKGPESTEVVTLVDAYAKPRAVSGNSLHCQSRGKLEVLIAELVAEALGIGS